MRSPPPATPRCDICGDDSPQAIEKHGIPIHECGKCRYRFACLPTSSDHVSTVYDDDYFVGGAAGYPDYLAQSELRKQHGIRYAQLVDGTVPTGRLLDVGAAAGFLMKGFEESGWKVRGLEPNEGIARRGEQEYEFDIRVGTLESFDEDQYDEPFDLISMIQVIAHFHDLDRALQNAATATKPGGYWLIETWDYRSLTARGFGKYWHEYSPPSVLRWFSPKSLRLLCARYDMQLISTGRPKKFIQGGHAKSLIRHSCENHRWLRPLSPLASLLPDVLQIPYPFDDVFWALFRNS